MLHWFFGGLALANRWQNMRNKGNKYGLVFNQNNKIRMWQMETVETMSLVDYLQALPERGLRNSLGELRIGIRRRTNWLEKRGMNVFDREWDVLLILDACRTDLLESVCNEYDFIDGHRSIWSVGGTSSEWIENTFSDVSDSTLQSTGYVTANPYSSRVDIDTDQFGHLDEVWRYAWDSSLGVVPPRAVTERAISVRRKHDMERLVVHYMQPHIPFLDDLELTRTMSEPDSGDFGTLTAKTVWERLRDREIEFDTVWKAYQDNLRNVLDELRILRRNMDANRMVISADHGNAMGEHGQYGHGRNERIKSVCRVPWEVTDATDTGEYTPTLEQEQGESDVDEQLRALGYK